VYAGPALGGGPAPAASVQVCPMNSDNSGNLTSEALIGAFIGSLLTAIQGIGDIGLETIHGRRNRKPPTALRSCVTFDRCRTTVTVAEEAGEHTAHLLRSRQRDTAGTCNDAFGVTVRSVTTSHTCPHETQTQQNTIRPR
jgi:hypothetical protein